MIDKENRLVEDKWYHVGLEYDPYRKDIIKVEGKYHFVGRLVVHLNNKLIFNLKDENGSVIIPFENIKWMVPLYNEELKVESQKPNYCDIEYKSKKKKEEDLSWE